MFGCPCKLGLGSFSQCDPIEVQLRNWKPKTLSPEYYDAPVGSPVVYDNPYMNEDVQVLSQYEQPIQNQSGEDKKKAQFWIYAGLAYLVLK